MFDADTQYQYQVEFHAVGEGKAAPVQAALQPDWEPLADHARLQALRAESPLAEESAATASPIWHERLGEPFVQRLRLRIFAGDEILSVETTTNYFASAVARTKADLVKQGTLDATQVYRASITAYRGPAAVRECQEPLRRITPVVEKPIAALLDSAAAYGLENQFDLPFFVPEEVIEQAVGIHRQHSEVETGGVLVGHVCRDTVDRRQLFVEVTTQVPARHAVQESMALTLTPRDFADVRAAVSLRGRGELWLGYWHSHPDWCRINGCDLAKRKTCPLAQEFFSQADCAVLRNSFSAAYCGGLVISESETSGVTWPLFGWHEGTVKKRAYWLRRAVAATPSSLTAAVATA